MPSWFWMVGLHRIIFVSDANDVAPFAVFSAVSGLELSLEKEQDKCRLNPLFTVGLCLF
jgi:hypothetical protein